MGPVGSFLRAVALWLCVCAGRAFVLLPTAPGVGRGVSASARWPARSQPLRGAYSSAACNRCLPFAPVASAHGIASRSRWVRMSSADQQVSTGGTGTGVQTIVKEVVKEMTVTENKEELAKEQWWRVILHNDEIHTFDYVTQSITKVVKKLTMKKAYEVTMETHKAGKATVTQAWKNKAEGYCLKLQQCGLTASIAPDAKFEGGEDGEGGEGGGE